MLNRLGKPHDTITELENVLAQQPKHTMALANSATYYINKKSSYCYNLFKTRSRNKA